MRPPPAHTPRYAVQTIERVLDGVQGTTALHICFGYPSFVPDHRPSYEFLAELAAAPVDQISIETAQANLDVSVLSELADKTIILGVIALDTAEVEAPETVADRLRRALPYKSPAELVAAPDCGMKYLPRDAAFAKLQALVAGARLVRGEVAAGSARST
jgi:5-methyltetrahydropteroyltriglutamate--homocysteine methyltransferase